MNEQLLRKRLTEAFEALAPFSKKFKVDYERYLVSIKMLVQLPGTEQLRFLDVGTGIGILPLTLNKLNLKAIGVDYFIFPKQGDEAFQIKEISTLKKIWEQEGVSIFDLDIYADAFLSEITDVDVIVSEATIEHLKDPRGFLLRINNLLPVGGYLLLTTPNSATLLKRLRFLVGLSPNWPIENFFSLGEKFTGHWREYTAKELLYMCKESGFNIISYRNENALAHFKSIRDWKKNLRALISLISWLIPGSREMHYVLCQKK